ncbi:DedA family protein [Pseudogracilibacillus auburnensis]|uniref:Membrane protein DedA with SNARE-associated domain n=1 Tax=Pseudogracilibacillus auburnensis TaxID=1494959 RepID=A0A2V3VET9_9BACI|nr:DedA family protein [Pseudogracilibacillus auburnensis]MBO1005862.1 DedA family protein [Pseudogracilibacillus auburnensis]PXW80336.1 membrane protein DedA with SNARE-associated domain [Pseudogracilibacillus auburnensis]
MQAWVIELMEQLGYVGVFFMMALENIFPPIPSEVILLFGGFMTTYTNLTVDGVIITATTGSVLGAIILYGIGMLINIERMEKVIDRWGHIIRLEKEDLHKANAWFENYGYWAVLLCRMVPIVRSLISIPAGMSGMKFWLFLLFTIIGTAIWNTMLVFVGAILGASWKDILSFFEYYSTIVYFLIAIGFILFILVYIHKGKRKK